MKKKTRLTILICVLAAVGLAGCGVKGPLEAPDSKGASFGIFVN